MEARTTIQKRGYNEGEEGDESMRKRTAGGWFLKLPHYIRFLISFISSKARCFLKSFLVHVTIYVIDAKTDSIARNSNQTSRSKRRGRNGHWEGRVDHCSNPNG